MLNVTCKKCKGNYFVEGDYATMLKKAEAGTLELMCVCDGLLVIPPPEDQEAYARQIRALMIAV